MKFDAYAVLAKLRSEGGGRATPATCATQHPQTSPHVAQVARVARRTAPDAEISDRPVPADACRTSRTCRTGQAVQPATADEPIGKVIQWTGKRYSPDAIRQGVAEAFDDWEAMNDPHDPRAWA